MTGRRLWLTRVRVRVTLSATVVGVLVAAVGSTLFVGGLRESLEQSLVNAAQQQADSVVARLDAGDSPTQAAITDKDDLVVQVVGVDGRLLAGNHPEVTRPVRTAAGEAEGVRVPGLGDAYAVNAERARDGRLVVVGLSDEQVSRATETAVVLLGIAVPLGVLVLAGVVWLAIGRALRPVEVMRREAAAITAEHLHARLAVPPGDDEIPLLATTLNELLDRIDGSARQQRQFVSDASHELRSPLATLRQLAEVARRHPGSTSIMGLADDVLAEEQRMEALVTALLTLARLEDGESSRVQVVDLDDVVLTEVDRLRARDDSPAVDISQVSGGQVHGDPSLVAQVVTNLLANAARHARTTVRVGLVEVDGTVTLVVEDDGEGIAEPDRDRVFDRFARLDEARARDAGGVGLGLAIVKKVVEGSHGTVLVEASERGGARFVVRLPGIRD